MHLVNDPIYIKRLARQQGTEFDVFNQGDNAGRHRIGDLAAG